MAGNETRGMHVEMPPDLYRRLRIEAASEGVTIKALVVEAIERLLREREAGRRT